MIRIETLLKNLYLEIVLMAFLLYLGRNAGNDISEIVWHFSQKPLVPFLWGMLMGHFFWGR